MREKLFIVQRMDYEPDDIYLSIDSIFEWNSRLTACRKEPETVEWIKSNIKPGDVMFDIGSNVGGYSFITDKWTRGGARIYCFEPSAANWHKLQGNIFLNKASSRIQAFPVALSDHTGVARLMLSDMTPGSALHQLDHSGETEADTPAQSALSYALDQFVEVFGLPYPNHIKIDVDGHEFNILQGARNVIANSALKSAIIEIEDYEGNEERVVNFMSEYGFVASRRHLHSEAVSRFGNVIFSR